MPAKKPLRSSKVVSHSSLNETTVAEESALGAGIEDTTDIAAALPVLTQGNRSRRRLGQAGKSMSECRPNSHHEAAQPQGASAKMFIPQGADPEIIRSGHIEYDTVYASNECEKRGPITVNVVNAPDNSTLQCGCENINCPFCNLMLSIEKTDPSVLQ